MINFLKGIIKTIQTLIRVILVITILGILMIVFLALGSHWRITNRDFAEIATTFNVFNGLHSLNKDIISGELNDMPDFFRDSISTLSSWSRNLPEVIIKERVGAIDAIINAFSLLCSTLTILLIMVLMIIVGIGIIIYGFVSATWELLFTGLLAIIASVFCLLAPIVLWIGGLIQNMTPGYALIWIFIGLPALVGGASSNLIILRGVTVIIFPTK